MQYANGYQPSRRQHLVIADLVKKKLQIQDTVIIHHVLMDSSARLYVQTEIQRVTEKGKVITFERVEV